MLGSYKLTECKSRISVQSFMEKMLKKISVEELELKTSREVMCQSTRSLSGVIVVHQSRVKVFSNWHIFQNKQFTCTVESDVCVVAVVCCARASFDPRGRLRSPAGL